MDALSVLDSRHVANEPLPEPVDRGCFGDADDAIKGASEVVLDCNKTAFTIDPFAGSCTRFVLGGLSSKSKVNKQETLPRCSCFHHESMTRGVFLHLGSKACGTEIEDRVVMLKGRCTVVVFLSMTQAAVTATTKPLMPEKLISAN